MAYWHEEYDERVEVPEEFVEELDECPEEKSLEEIEKMEIPEVWWKEQLEEIENPEIKKKEIEAAEEILKKREILDQKFESGEITEYQHWDESNFELRREEIKASTRASLASIDLTYDHLGALVEEVGVLPSGDVELLDKIQKDLPETIDRMGPEAAQELADHRLEEEEMNDEMHKIISRRVRLHGK
jgi:hypothetical protein